MATNNAWMNHVSNRMVHSATANGKTFYNVSFPYAESITGFASVSVSEGQVRQSTKRDGTVSETTKNILLGAPEKIRQVSICTVPAANGEKAQYAKVEMTNAQIVEAYEASRKAYKEAQKAATAEAEA